MPGSPLRGSLGVQAASSACSCFLTGGGGGGVGARETGRISHFLGRHHSAARHWCIDWVLVLIVPRRFGDARVIHLILQDNWAVYGSSVCKV